MKVETSLGPVAVGVRGAGSPLVLLHANPGNRRDYDAVILSLADRYRTYAVDWPGYGESPNSKGEASAMAYAAILPEILDGLGLNRVALIGNSVGGYAAARLAIDAPDRVASLVLVSSGGFSLGGPAAAAVIRFMGTPAVMRSLAGRLPYLYLRHRTAVVQTMIARDVVRGGDPAATALTARIWRSFGSPDHDLRKRAARISAPALLVWGTRDPMVGLDARRARRAMPRARWCALPSGHAPFAELPERFLEAVLPFLDEWDGTPPGRAVPKP